MQTIHLVTHTHWDREWYLTFQQFRLKLVHLVDDLLDILDKDPLFINFLLDGQTIVLDDYLLMRPDRRSDLCRYIQAGRISVGPWHILPDEFLVSPEATIRNLLQARRTGRQFGPLMQVGYIPDPFGHIGQMPQILNGFGITSACVQRGLGDEPCEFWWQAPDGSQVLMVYLRDGYSNAAELPDADPEHFSSEVRRLSDALEPYSASGNILLMWGTDHKEASPGASRMIAAAQDRLDGDLLVHSSLPAYIDAARTALQDRRSPEPEIPVITGELRSSQRHALLPNVLSTRMWIKQCNRACENLLEKWAEPFSTWTSLACGDNLPPGTLRQPASILRQVWRLLMDNHPHDSICGCSIDQVHEEMRPRFDQVDQIGEKITTQSLEALAAIVHTSAPFTPEVSGELSAIVIFNPTARPRTDYVSLTFDAPAGTVGFELLDETSASLPFETSGLGSQDLLNMTMLPDEFVRSIGMVSEGHVAGMTLQEIDVHREDSQVYIKVILSDTSTPNLDAWFEGVKKIKVYLEDRSVTAYHVHARCADTTHLTFAAADVPGFGYRTYWIRAKPNQKAGKPPVRLGILGRALLPLAARLAQSALARRLAGGLNPEKESQPPYRIENEFFLVEATRDGTLMLTDRRSGAVYPGLNRFVDGGDGGDEYNCSQPLKDRQVAPKLMRVRVLHGPVRQTLELHLEMDVPEKLAEDRKARSRKTVRLPLVTFASLTAGVPRLDVHTEVDNQARDHRLRVHFPAPFVVQGGHLATFDGHFEIVRRPIGLPAFDETWNEQPRPEVPQRAFACLSDGTLGLGIANRGLPEVEVLERPAMRGQTEIALTLLRCVGWLSRDDLPGRKGPAGPAMETPGAQMIGRWDFDYSILPFAGPEDPAVYWQAYAFESPLRAVSAPVHTGGLPGRGSFLQIEPAEFVVSAVKTTESEDGWLVRGYNIGDNEIAVKLKPWRPFPEVDRVNLAEEKAADLQTGRDGTVEFLARGHEIVTLLFKF